MSTLGTNEPKPKSAPAEAEAFPPGLPNAFWFAGFNALSFQIVLAAPLVLYAQVLGPVPPSSAPSSA